MWNDHFALRRFRILRNQEAINNKRMRKRKKSEIPNWHMQHTRYFRHFDIHRNIQSIRVAFFFVLASHAFSAPPSLHSRAVRHAVWIYVFRLATESHNALLKWCLALVHTKIHSVIGVCVFSSKWVSECIASAGDWVMVAFQNVLYISSSLQCFALVAFFIPFQKVTYTNGQ